MSATTKNAKGAAKSLGKPAAVVPKQVDEHETANGSSKKRKDVPVEADLTPKKKNKVETAANSVSAAATSATAEPAAVKSKKQKTKPSEETKNNGNHVEANGHDEEGATPSPIKASKKLKNNEQSSVVKTDVESFRKSLGIAVEGEDEASGVFEPIQDFSKAPFSKEIRNYCQKYDKPSPIQSQCWPICVVGRDVVGIAATGSGKTLAFALPGIKYIKTQPPLGRKLLERGPIMLVLAPTRELALQIDSVFEELGKVTGITSLCVYGGVSKDNQRKVLAQGAHVVVATPGRLLDLIQEGACSLQLVSFLVLDEADRMLDMGFEQDIRTILSKLRNQRQTLMFSATWPTAIQSLAKEFLSSPIKVVVGSQDLAASHSVNQIVEVIEHDQKETRLQQLLQTYHKSRTNRVLVFVLYKKEAERIERFLRSKGWNPASIHGDKNQQERTFALQSFRDGSRPLLIATDVAARGLDIPDVEYVINLTFPLTIEDYVHRIGRTGRAGATGTSHTLFTTFDKSHAGELVNVLKEAGQPVPESLLKFGTHTKKKEHKLYGAHFKDVDADSKSTHVTFDD